MSTFKTCVFCAMLVLSACAKAPPDAPCDNYGRNCDPKIKINQWTPQSSF